MLLSDGTTVDFSIHTDYSAVYPLDIVMISELQVKIKEEERKQREIFDKMMSGIDR